MADSVERVASYVPARVVRQLPAGQPPLDVPRADRFAGAVLMADISGFTALTEALSKRGDVGAEQLTQCLNVYFGRLIDLIVEHGGDIVKFAGDALLAIWPSAGKDVATSTCHAVQCGLAAQQQLHNFAATPDVRLSLRISISAGKLAILHVGGVEGRRELVATGEPLAGLSSANAQGKVGEVTVSADTWPVIKNQVDGEPWPGGAVRVRSLRTPVTLQPPQPVPAANRSALLEYVQPAVIDQLDREGASWIAELRRVTVVFVNFPGLTPATPLDRAQAVMRELQTVLHRFEGTINKISLDDKGASMVAAFGLPPLSHEDDPERAVRAAMSIRERLALLQVRHSIGITTGNAFCGIVGNATRREYTLIGDVVNLSARLMQAAKGGLLCDRATYDGARARLAFEQLPCIQVKGKTGDIPVFHPLDGAERAGVQRASDADTTVGRVAEQAAIEDAIRALAERGQGSVIVIEGMAGIGKSRLIEEVRRRAQRSGLPCLDGGGDAMENATAFHAWRGVFEHAFGLDATAGLKERHAHVQGRIAERGKASWMELLPLLNPVLRTTFPQTDTTAAMNDRARAGATYDLLADLLAALPGDGTHSVVVLEDAQWMDSTSVALAAHVCARRLPLVIVFALRQIPGQAFDDIDALSRAPRAQRFELGPLSADEAVVIACRSLGVASVPTPVEGIIRSKADGNPLLSEQLAGALRDANLIHITNGECLVSPSADLRTVDLPNSIQGAVTARLDRLPPSQRLLLKLASVIGRVFESDVLLRLHEKHGDQSTVRGDLSTLQATKVTTLERTEPAPAYAFSHLTLQEVSYKLMLFSQRRQLHQTMAELIEERHGKDLYTAYPLLAFHWRRAVEGGDADPALVWKAVDYLHKAGDQAMQQFANNEAVEFLSGALTLLETLPPSDDRARKELALCCAVGAPLLVTKGFAAPETQRAYSRAMELCQTIENSPEQFSAVYGLWGVALMSTQLGRARTLAAEVYRLAQSASDPELLLPANRAVGDTAFWNGDLPTARTHLEEAVALYRPEHHATEVFRTGQDQGAIASGLSVWVVWLLGYPDVAMERMEWTMALARKLNHHHTIAMSMQTFTMMLQFREEAAKVLELAEAQLALTREQGFPLWEAGAHVMRGWSRFQHGHLEEGLAEMRRGIDGWRATGAELGVPYYLGMLAEAHGRAGRHDAALGVIAEAIASWERSGECWWLAEIWRIEGELRLAMPSPDEAAAETLFQKALAFAQQQKSRSLELRAAASLLRLSARQGKPLEAGRQRLATILDAFTEGHDTADRRQRRLCSVDRRVADAPNYVIRGGIEGRERLRILGRVMRADSTALFARVGAGDGHACLDVGCGGGDATLDLARRVAPNGHVIGLDIDPVKLQIARDEADQQGVRNVEFRETDIRREPAGSGFDIVYARFLLTHLSDPAETVAVFHRHLKSGGMVAVEDIDFSGHFNYPESKAFQRYYEMYCATVKRRGGDPEIGPRLPALLQQAGFDEVGAAVVQPVGTTGEAKLLSPLTMEAIAGAVVADGLATQPEIDAMIDEMYAFVASPTTLAGMPRVVQAWGRKR